MEREVQEQRRGAAAAAAAAARRRVVARYCVPLDDADRAVAEQRALVRAVVGRRRERGARVVRERIPQPAEAGAWAAVGRVRARAVRVSPVVLRRRVVVAEERAVAAVRRGVLPRDVAEVPLTHGVRGVVQLLEHLGQQRKRARRAEAVRVDPEPRHRVARVVVVPHLPRQPAGVEARA